MVYVRSGVIPGHGENDACDGLAAESNTLGCSIRRVSNGGAGTTGDHAGVAEYLAGDAAGNGVGVIDFERVLLGARRGAAEVVAEGLFGPGPGVVDSHVGDAHGTGGAVDDLGRAAGGAGHGTVRGDADGQAGGHRHLEGGSRSGEEDVGRALAAGDIDLRRGKGGDGQRGDQADRQQQRYELLDVLHGKSVLSCSLWF